MFLTARSRLLASPPFMRPLATALVAAEAAPFAKTGGLADVITGLGR